MRRCWKTVTMTIMKTVSYTHLGSISGQSLIPNPPTLRNYERILDQDFWLWMWNSFKVSSISAILAGLITLMSAFAFSRFRWACLLYTSRCV